MLTRKTTRPCVTLTFDLLTPKVDRFILAPWTTYASWHQSRFIRFPNTVFTSLITDERTDGRTDRPGTLCPRLPTWPQWHRVLETGVLETRDISRSWSYVTELQLSLLAA